MNRLIYKELLDWKQGVKHLPLLLRGARQVGKTYIVEQFALNEFDSFVNINFELQPKFNTCFINLDSEVILTQISALTKVNIIPGRSLLFLDEIQLCPEALVALRYFKEKMPELHVIAAGSLLEFMIAGDQYQMPVGRVRSIHMTPVSFKEFLLIHGYTHAYDLLLKADIEKGIPAAVHDDLIALVRKYFILGGMPEVISDYLQDKNLLNSQITQSSILSTYRSDFGKYAKLVQHKYLQLLMDKIPGIVGEKFQYNKIDPDTRARELKEPLNLLCLAGIAHKVYHTSASGLPLQSQVDDRQFKLLFMDIGLAQSTMMLDPSILLQRDLMLINRGGLAEAFVGQELLAYLPSHMPLKLMYWQREKTGAMAEVDYVINVDQHIIPIEVKAGKTGGLRSLRVFMREKNSPLGIRVSQKSLQLEGDILSVPFYMIFEIPRLVRMILD